MVIDITPMGEELESEFYRTLRIKLETDGKIPRTHIGDILIMEEFEEIIKFYAYCTRMTGNVEVFVSRAYNTILKIRDKDGNVPESEVEMRRRMIG